MDLSSRQQNIIIGRTVKWINLATQTLKIFHNKSKVGYKIIDLCHITVIEVRNRIKRLLILLLLESCDK